MNEQQFRALCVPATCTIRDALDTLERTARNVLLDSLPITDPVFSKCCGCQSNGHEKKDHCVSHATTLDRLRIEERLVVTLSQLQHQGMKGCLTNSS